jgi:hypothetical protein
MNLEADSKKKRYQLCSGIDPLSNQHRFWIHSAKAVNDVLQWIVSGLYYGSYAHVAATILK